MSQNPIVLYVEDDRNNRILVRRVLAADGFKVLEASNASGAMKILYSTRPDLILMDINLPEVDGYTLTAQIREMPDLFRVPIVAITANAMRGDKERILDAGCDGYIQKPIDVDALPSQLRRYLKEVPDG